MSFLPPFQPMTRGPCPRVFCSREPLQYMARPTILLALTCALSLSCGASALAYEKLPAAPAAGASAATTAARKPPAKLVDLNLASRSELKTLPGIGDAEAAKIVAARPYKSKADLVTKNVLPLEAYDRLSKLVVVDLRKPAPKPKS